MVFLGPHDEGDKNLIVVKTSCTTANPNINLLMSLCNSSEIPVEASQAPRDIGSTPTRSVDFGQRPV